MNTYTETFEYDELTDMKDKCKQIREQIGIMTLMACGAREFKFLEKGKIGLHFRVNHGRTHQYIIIELNSLDYYNVTLKRITKKDEKILEEYKDIDCMKISDTVYRMVNK
jgi:hypothetical protein